MSAGNISQIAELLSGTARLAVCQETNQGTRNSSQDEAVAQMIVQAVQEAKLSSGVQAASFASAVNSTLFEQQKIYETHFPTFDQEPVGLLMDASSKLNQSTATVQGLTEVS